MIGTSLMDEREFELVNIIGADLGANQRDLSRQMDLSLGMTNMLIRRLLSKGYIRIQQLNKKKVEYLLTPKGFAEKMRKSVNYTLKTISSIGLIKTRLAEVLIAASREGHRKFYILGESDLAGLIEIVLSEKIRSGYELAHVREVLPSMKDGLVLVCREGVKITQAGITAIDLIEELAKDSPFRVRELSAVGEA
jgi:DNA-binding MarR family transcriptional regulator